MRVGKDSFMMMSLQDRFSLILKCRGDCEMEDEMDEHVACMGKI
jgi:hypothetical protein